MCFLFSLLYDAIFGDGSCFFILFYINNLTYFPYGSMCPFLEKLEDFHNS